MPAKIVCYDELEHLAQTNGDEIIPTMIVCIVPTGKQIHFITDISAISLIVRCPTINFSVFVIIQYVIKLK